MTKPWLAERPLFTARYGRRSLNYPIRATDLDDPANVWFSRHRWGTAMTVFLFGTPPENGVNRCTCRLGVAEGPPPADFDPEDEARVCACIQRATQEDGLCDECRVWCVVVDAEGVVRQSTTMRPAEIGREATRGYAPIDQERNEDIVGSVMIAIPEVNDA